MVSPSFNLRCEQAVYGSFPFWRRGYSFLARSAGCRPEWAAALRTAAQQYGEPPCGTLEADALFSKRAARGPWMVVGVFPQGMDDQGRPGALAFHALFVSARAYFWAGGSPFVFADRLRGDWTERDIDAVLPDRLQTARGAGHRRSLQPARAEVADRETIGRIADALARGRRVIVPSAGPIDDLARSVWRALPWRVRARRSVATWAFDNANNFDLVALPRITASQRAAADMVLALQ